MAGRKKVMEEEAAAAARTLQRYCKQNRGCGTCIFRRKGMGGYAARNCKMENIPKDYNLRNLFDPKKKREGSEPI